MSFRLTIRLASGRITIDGVDISKIGLNTLRSRIAIIPQEPVLFSGTLRSNLDPFDSHGDDVLHDAMKRACLTNATSSGQAKSLSLDTEIEDEGTNLSTYEHRNSVDCRCRTTFSSEPGSSIGEECTSNYLETPLC